MSGWHRRTVTLLAATVLCVLTALVTVPSSIAFAQDDSAASLVIKPSNYDGSFYDLVVEPGQRLELAVEIGNTGDHDVEALTYAADGFTQINGGLGIADADAPKTGPTLWSNYRTKTISLAAGVAVIETFQLDVPAEALPGDYITALVVQEDPAQLETAHGVTITQVLRQAITIRMTVPGPAAAQLGIEGAGHSISGGNSVIEVGLRNTGHRTLTPSGEFRLYDADGVELTRFPVSMGKVYAQTTAAFEVPFTTRLNPGAYTISVTLADAERDVTAEASGISLTVARDEATATSDGPTAASVNQSSDGAEAHDGQADDGLPAWALFGSVAAGLLAGVALALTAGTFLRRRRAQSTRQSIATGSGDD